MISLVSSTLEFSSSRAYATQVSELPSQEAYAG